MIADNNAVHTEDGIARLQMENQLAVPGDGYRYHSRTPVVSIVSVVNDS